MRENYTLMKTTHQNEVQKLFNSGARKKAIQATQLIYALWRPMQVWAGYDKYKLRKSSLTYNFWLSVDHSHRHSIRNNRIFNTNCFRRTSLKHLSFLNTSHCSTLGPSVANTWLCPTQIPCGTFWFIFIWLGRKTVILMISIMERYWKWMGKWLEIGVRMC